METKAKQIKEFEEYIREPEKVFDRVCSKLRFRGVIETFSKALDTAEQRGREEVGKRAKKVVKELGLPKDYLDFISAVFFVKLPSETKITKQDRKMVNKLKNR